MHFVGAVTVFLSLAMYAGSDESRSYSYIEKDAWPQQFPLHCSRHRQSPINIVDSKAEVKFFGDLVYTNYEFPPVNLTATNNQQTLSLTVTSPRGLPLLSGGGLSGVYELTNVHFHWGRNDTQGSEHTIDGKRFPLEMHLVHKKQGLTPNAFLNDQQGLAVLSILFQVSPNGNAALGPILNVFPAIISGGKSAVVPRASALSALLPLNKQVFYRYRGSLTTPPCNQAVVWTVFAHTVPVSPAQLSQFRKLSNLRGTNLMDNFRNTQPLNGRTIYKSLNRRSSRKELD